MLCERNETSSHPLTFYLELQQEIHKETTRYIRHGLKGSIPKDPKENGKEKDTKDKDALIPARVTAAYAELDRLSAEKMALAQRLVETMTRVNARLDHDLGRVVRLTGEPPQEHYEVRGGYVVGTLPNHSGAPVTLSANVTSSRSTAIDKVVETLRAAEAPPSVTSAVAQPTQKRMLKDPVLRLILIRLLSTGRRLNASGTGTSSRAHTPQARARAAQQARATPPRSRRPPSSLGDEDAEGEDDADADGDADDQDESGEPEDKEL